MERRRIYIRTVPNLEAAVDARFTQLISEGASFRQRVSQQTGSASIWVTQPIEARSFLIAAVNLIGLVTTRRGVHYEQAALVLTDERLKNGVPIYCVTTMLGTLRATYDDLQRGLLTDVTYATFAVTFDDFLDQASDFHKSGRSRNRRFSSRLSSKT